MSFGLLCFIYELACSSFGGDIFCVADDSMEMILMQTELVFKAGVQSLSRVLRQMQPQEQTCSCLGGVPMNITSGLSNGYSSLNLNYSVNTSPWKTDPAAPSKVICQIIFSASLTSNLSVSLKLFSISACSLLNLWTS